MGQRLGNARDQRLKQEDIHAEVEHKGHMWHPSEPNGTPSSNGQTCSTSGDPANTGGMRIREICDC